MHISVLGSVRGRIVVCAVCVLMAVAALLVGPGRASAYAPPPGGYVAEAPALVLDTQTGFGAPIHPLAGHQTITVPVKVPASGVTGFDVTLTAVNPTATGYLIAWPHGAVRPVASMVTFAAGRTVATDAFVKGDLSLIDLYNGSSGSVDVKVVVTGYTTFSGWARGAAVPVTASRLLDTRSGIGAPVGAIPAGGSIVVQVSGRGGVPVSLPGCPCVGAAALTLTAVAPTQSGYVSAWAHGAPPAATSAINLTTGLTASNLVWAALGPDGKVVLHNATAAPLQLVADVEGYNVAAGAANAGGQLFAGTQTRLLDTRIALGATGPVGPHATITLGGLSTMWAYLLDVIVTSPGQSGDLIVWTHGTARPVYPTVFFRAGQTVSDLALVIPSGAGQIDVYNDSNATVQVVGDQEGRSSGCC
jgi:hypothetical protein